MSRTVVFQEKRSSIDMKLLLFFEELRGQCSFRRGRKREIPTFDSCAHRKVPARILMSCYLSANRVKPFVAVRVIEVPVGVDEVPDGIGADVGQCLGDPRSRGSNAG